MSEYEILKHTQQYELTGHISDELIPFFDQHGRWIGDRRNWRRSVWHTAAKRMRRAILPVPRRTSRGQAGRSLLTSFIWRDQQPALIPYCEVMGRLEVPTKAWIHAPNLRTIGGSLHTLTTATVDLPQLRCVGGDLFTRNSSNFRAPRLQHVQGHMTVSGFEFPCILTVGGRLSVRWSIRFHGPLLRSVGGDLNAHSITSFKAPELVEVGGNLVTSGFVWTVSVPVLQSIGGDFVADLAATIIAKRLRFVGGSIFSGQAENFYQGWVRVGGKWHAHRKAVLQWRINEVARRALSDPGFEL